jgi:8-oxo-dGTP diphosphatase
MNQRVRGIIIDDGKIVLIERVKGDNTYYIFPGGGVEEGETILQALHREMKEELGVEISVGEHFAEYRHKSHDGEEEVVHDFYLCKEIGGTFGAGDGPEYQPNTPYAVDGTHDPIRIPLSKLKDIDLKPKEIKKLVVEFFL